jgi:hypothetical protein
MVEGLAPGLMLIALKSMRPWLSQDERGARPPIDPMTTALLLNVREVDNQLRILVVIGNRLETFSCHKDNVWKNWSPLDDYLKGNWRSKASLYGYKTAPWKPFK